MVAVSAAESRSAAAEFREPSLTVSEKVRVPSVTKSGAVKEGRAAEFELSDTVVPAVRAQA